MAGNSATRKKLLRSLAVINGWKCWYCGIPVSEFNAWIDHIVPKSGGGDDGFDNLALTCAMCNRAKGTLSLEEFMEWLHRAKKTSNNVLEMY